MAGLIRSVSHLLAAVFNDRSAFDQLWLQSQAGGNSAESLFARWQGEWISEANGHHGELRSLLDHKNPTQLEARFCATYARWLRVSYAVFLEVKEHNGSLRLKGEADLGMLAGGVYEYEGELN